MRKTYCDFCGDEITTEEIFSLELYNDANEETILDQEICEDCSEEIEEIIKEKRNKE